MRRCGIVLAALFLPAGALAQEEPSEGLQDYLFGLCFEMQWGAAANDPDRLEEQLDLGGNIECRMRDEYDGATPLVIAAAWGGAEAVLFLVENGADVTARDRKGWSALRHARARLEYAEEGDRAGLTRMIEILEQAGAAE